MLKFVKIIHNWMATFTTQPHISCNFGTFQKKSLLKKGTRYIMLKFPPITNSVIFFHFVNSVNLNVKFNLKNVNNFVSEDWLK